MTRSRLFVVSSFALVAAGALAALGALVLSPARASVGPLPAEALVLPADATFVAGVDVKRFTASPFYKKYARAGLGTQGFVELEEKTGLDPERDLDVAIVAGTQGKSIVALVSGSFDRYKLGRHLEGDRHVTFKKEHGTEVYVFGEGSAHAEGLAFLDDRTLAFGDVAAVEAAAASHAEGRKPLRDNTALVELLEKVRPGSTFWMVGDKSLLAQLPRSMPGPGGPGGTSLDLPALKSLTVTGDLDPAVSIEVTGGVADEAAARNLADVVRGLAALFALQASQQPEMKSIASAISVTTEGNQVHLSARFPYELLDSLQGRRGGAAPEAKTPLGR